MHHNLPVCVCALACPALFDPMDCSPPAPLSMASPRQEYWSGLPVPPPRDLPSPGIKPTSPEPPALAGGFFTTEPPGKPIFYNCCCCSVAQSCLNLCNPMECSTPGLPVPPTSGSLPKFMSTASVMPSSHLILCHPPLLLPSIFPSIKDFSKESSVCIR